MAGGASARPSHCSYSPLAAATPRAASGLSSDSGPRRRALRSPLNRRLATGRSTSALGTGMSTRSTRHRGPCDGERSSASRRAYCPRYTCLRRDVAPLAAEQAVAFLGGGDSFWYALDASRREGWVWSIPNGDSSPTGGHYNWSSPFRLQRFAPTSASRATATAPLVQGKLMRCELLSSRVENVWKVVPDGQVGGGIWTSPVVDAARNSGVRDDGQPGPITQLAPRRPRRRRWLR